MPELYGTAKILEKNHKYRTHSRINLEFFIKF